MIKNSTSFALAIFLISFSFSQELKIKEIITDDSSEIGTAGIKLEVEGGTDPYTYHWDKANIGLNQNEASGLSEGEKYHVKIVDANGLEAEKTIKIPAKSFAESVSAQFTPLVTFLDKILFFDPFTPFYDNRVRDDNGEIVLNPNGTPQTIKIPFLVVWLVLGALFLTLRMGFINLRGIRHSLDLVRGKYDDPNAPGQVTHFQALATAVSGTVGLGNIAGVAVAIATGGPGATFWMILAGFLGMSMKFVECTLGVKYRDIASNGKVYGGPMNYLNKGFSKRGFKGLGKILSVVYAVVVILAAFAAGSMFQSNQAAAQIANVFKMVDPSTVKLGTGIIIAGLVFIVIVGGIKSIANVTDKIVPAMAGMYIIMCLGVILADIKEVGNAFRLIFDGAFSSEAMYGGFLGVMIQGFRRAAFSNEAGLGSASIAHSAAKTNHPVSEGFVALLEPFIDTIVVCTLTALVLIFSGVYTDVSISGSAMTAKGFGTVYGSISNVLITIAIFLFAFSTIITWSYYGVKATAYLFGDSKFVNLGFKIIFVCTVIFGAVIGLGAVVDFADMMFLSLALPNLIGLYLMSGEVASDLKKYLSKVKSGNLKE
ncbi:MAG: alanine/glycine:cation symporter family protein [Flavobacteriales bacterium]